VTEFSEVALLGSYPAAERGGPFGKGILHLREKSDLRRNYMMDRERPSASDSGEKIPKAWIG